ncbi:MAG: anthranilate phosphoribosyltransferase [Lentisphaeria bacterium]|jgi:anthranilate phosphoribosyltransferase
MNIQQALAQIAQGKNLCQGQMSSVMRQVMTGEGTQAQIGALLMGLRVKGETIDEITGAVEVMRELATPVRVKGCTIVDTCGTGGDGANLFNVSTASAFVVAAAGGHVAKHGNRSVSSSTGSADVLESAGLNLQASAEHVARAIEGIGVGFMFAPAHHGAMKHAVGPRKELGMRTIFNLLGPMTNPAGVKRQVLGVFDSCLCRPLAEVLQRLGSEHVLVVSAGDGLDEFSIAANTHVAELKENNITEYEVSAEAFGFNYDNLDGLSVTSAEESLALIKSAFSGGSMAVSKKAADMIALNAGAAIYVSGIANTLEQGVSMAEDAIYSGGAKEKIKELVEFMSVAAA